MSRITAAAFPLFIGGTMALAKTNPPPSPVIIHNRTEYFIDIEAEAKRVWIGCDRPQKSDVSYMVFYVLEADQVHEFMYRRVLAPAQCAKAEREYRDIASGAKTIRIVGTHPRQYLEPIEVGRVTQPVPSAFLKPSKILHSTFMRLQAGGRCKAYFREDCDLPKNYWAGTIPPSSEIRTHQ